jgi:hypothetical protein
MLVPSAFFAFGLYKKQQFTQLANSFIEKEFTDKGNILVYKKINYSRSSSSIELAFLNKSYSASEQEILNDTLKNFGLGNTRLIIRLNSSDSFLTIKNDILNEVNKKDNVLSEKDKQIAVLRQQLIENTFDNKKLLSEIHILFPAINAVSVTRQNIATLDTIRPVTFFIYNASETISDKDKDKLKNWMLEKLNVDTLEILATDKK